MAGFVKLGVLLDEWSLKFDTGRTHTTYMLVQASLSVEFHIPLARVKPQIQIFCSFQTQGSFLWTLGNGRVQDPTFVSV